MSDFGVTIDLATFWPRTKTGLFQFKDASAKRLCLKTDQFGVVTKVYFRPEKYHVFSNPRATNPFPGGIMSFIFNSHLHTDMASYDDFEHDNY